MSSNTIGKDLKQVLAVSITFILSLIGVMLFSPFASQFYDAHGRGVSCAPTLDQLIINKEYEEAFCFVNSEIEGLEDSVPRIAYLDRFLPKEKRYEASLKRLEIYELQWKRIEILSMMGDYSTLRQSLKKYTSIIGYHQEDAKEMLNQMEEN